MAISSGTVGILPRIEEMLNALKASEKSASGFKEACAALEHIIQVEAESLKSIDTFNETDKRCLASIVKQLSILQKRAEIRASIPNELQKDIAEQLS